VLDALLALLTGVSNYRSQLAKKGATEAQLPPDVSNHLVIGINAVTKALEPPGISQTRTIDDDGRAAKRLKRVEELRLRVEKDREQAPRIAETLRRTGLQPARAPAIEEMAVDGLQQKEKVRYSIIKRRLKRRRACREAFLARKRQSQLVQLEKQLKHEETKDQIVVDEMEVSPLAFVFVCRPDINPPSLVAHFPPLVAAYNARLGDQEAQCGIVQLNMGAEANLCRALHLRRAAVVGIRVSLHRS
jgi:hypothetical protein